MQEKNMVDRSDRRKKLTSYFSSLKVFCEVYKIIKRRATSNLNMIKMRIYGFEDRGLEPRHNQ